MINYFLCSWYFGWWRGWLNWLNHNTVDSSYTYSTVGLKNCCLGVNLLCFQGSFLYVSRITHFFSWYEMLYFNLIFAVSCKQWRKLFKVKYEFMTCSHNIAPLLTWWSNGNKTLQFHPVYYCRAHTPTLTVMYMWLHGQCLCDLVVITIWSNLFFPCQSTNPISLS